MAPRFTPLVQSLPATVPFVGPETQERARGRTFDARLGANESVFGPSPKVIDAIARAATGSWKYPDPENFELKQSLAGHLGVAPECVVVGEGIDGLLGYTVRLLVGPGDAVVTSDGAYPTFNYHVAGFGGTLHKVPYRDDLEDIDGLLSKARETDAKLIYLANPDNPMGTWHEAEAIADMIARLPEGCVVILDEAYAEFAPGSAIPPLEPENESVIRMRTFSKAYGMAGMRVGYAIGHPALISAFDKIRNHFGMCRVSQWAALAALADTDYLAEVQDKVAAARIQIAGIARENGLTPLPSAANFVTIDCGGDAAFAERVMSGLIDAGIFVRKPFAHPGDRCVRISCAPPDDLAVFAKALPRALDTSRA